MRLVRIRITILCEKLVGRLVGPGEYGFSVFTESSQGNYLFDTGNDHGIVANSHSLSSMDVLEVYWKFKKEEL